jgi:hypothetical protein
MEGLTIDFSYEEILAQLKINEAFVRKGCEMSEAEAAALLNRKLQAAVQMNQRRKLASSTKPPDQIPKVFQGYTASGSGNETNVSK